MRKRIRVACAAALGAGAVVLGASSAQAQTTTPCATLISSNTALASGATAVYVTGSSASQTPLQAIAVALASKGVAIVYQKPDSCVGVGDLINQSADIAASNFLDPAQVSGGLAKPVACAPPASTPPDIAPSDVFPDTCASKLNIGTVGAITPTTTSGIRDVWGPVQAMTFAVPAGSSANSISAEAAYVVFGYDATTYTVSPWTVPGSIYTRPNTSGTMNMLGAAIGLDPKKFANATPCTTGCPAQLQGGTGNMQSVLAGATSNANATIGQLSWSAVETFSGSDAGAGAFKVLAFQGTGQKCGYTPSSSASALDMINVRQGRYEVWGPLHFLVNVDASGNYKDHTGATNPAVTTLMNYIVATGNNPPASVSMDAGAFDGGVTEADIQAIISAEAKPGYVVPWCAMQATRTTEIGAPASYQPAAPCGCFYESVLGVSTSSYCHTCGSGCSGSTPVCRYGFCEAQ
jgi:hypothetical protein